MIEISFCHDMWTAIEENYCSKKSKNIVETLTDQIELSLNTTIRVVQIIDTYNITYYFYTYYYYGYKWNIVTVM